MADFYTPDWVKDAIFYQIFPDRFAKSASVHKPSNLEPWDSAPTFHGYKGGDLMGVAEKLDYLVDLGINALYLCPIFESTANHRYHTQDYYKVDAVLGGDPAFRHLLDECHARGIKIMIDGVFNHASRGFYYFNHALENGKDSPYLDWFHFHGFPVHAYNTAHANYDCWWGLPALPKLNTNTPAVREYLWGVAEHWLKFGADAWRLDVPNEINDDEFWREFRRRVKNTDPDAYICGEIWEDASRWLQGDQFDSVMNYLFTASTHAFFIQQAKWNTEVIRNSGLNRYGSTVIDAAQFGNAIKTLLARYPREVTYVQLNLLGSHDTPRFLTVTGDDKSAVRLATLFMMCYPGAPNVYYGDEIGMTGKHDPDSRKGFPWENEASWDKDLHAYTRAAIGLRKAHSALRRGEYDTLYGQGQLYIAGRHDNSERLIMAFNVGNSPVAGMPHFVDGDRAAYLPAHGQLRDLFAQPGRIYQIGEDSTVADFELAARTGTVLEVVSRQ